MENKVLTNALALAAQGFRILPTWGVRDGICLCPLDAECPHPGKHPALSGNWRHYASKSPEIIAGWFQNQKRNYGVALNRQVMVVDVDLKNDGDKTLASFESEFGKLPATVAVKSGGGGSHFYYRRPAHLLEKKINNREIMKGVDLKTVGGYVIGPGSNHASGREYTTYDIEGFKRMAVLDHPELLVEISSSKVKKKIIRQITCANSATPTSEVAIEEGDRNDFLFRLACSLQSRGISGEHAREALKSVNQKLCHPPLTEGEAIACAMSADRYFEKERQFTKPSYSLKDDCFYGPIGKLVVEIAEDSEASAIGILAQTLTLIGACFGRTARLDLGNINLYPNLYTVVVGDI